MPLVIFGVMGIVVGIMALWLPETLCSPMPQTVEQAETWPEDYKIYCCSRPRGPREEVTNGLTDKAGAKEHGNLLIETPTFEKKFETML